MANAVIFDCVPALAATVEWANNRGVFVPSGLVVFTRQALPTDPVGTFVLTLTNLVVGSAVQIEDQAGTTTFHNSTASAPLKSISLQAYSPGSPLNNLRIKVRKGNATTYKPWETLATAIVGSQSIYVSQIPDE